MADERVVVAAGLAIQVRLRGAERMRTLTPRMLARRRRSRKATRTAPADGRHTHIVLSCGEAWWRWGSGSWRSGCLWLELSRG